MVFMDDYYWVENVVNYSKIRLRSCRFRIGLLFTASINSLTVKSACSLKRTII